MECNAKKREYYINNKDKHKEWDKKHHEKLKQNVIECPVCEVMVQKHKQAKHEQSNKHQKNLEIQQQKAKEKEKARIRHRETLQYVNDVFASDQF